MISKTGIESIAVIAVPPLPMTGLTVFRNPDTRWALACAQLVMGDFRRNHAPFNGAQNSLFWGGVQVVHRHGILVMGGLMNSEEGDDGDGGKRPR